jgi:DNA-binding Xre family transcriptional regulator
MSISEQLRRAIEKLPETFYRIAKEADVDWGTLQRFVDGSRPSIRIETVDKLCAYLELELAAMARKRPASPTPRRRRARE